ncbi:MAG: enoyl-CoA hydratase/isomerase family protein [Phycisphaerae bacterium]|jgi:enoyl-CoA hydratase/carnithine racemase
MVSTRVEGSILLVRLERGDKKNALTPPMLDALAGALEQGHDARAVVMSGAGGVFCSGFDLSSCRDDPSSGVLDDLLRGLAGVCRLMRNLPCPVVVSAHGAALAGGCAMVAHADFAATDRAAKLGYPVVKLGISPAVSAPGLASTCGHGPARSRLLDSSTIDGAEALRIGLVSHLIDAPEACEATALEIAAMLAAKPPHAMAATKRLLGELDAFATPAMLDEALATSRSLAGGREQRTMLAAAWAKPASR